MPTQKALLLMVAGVAALWCGTAGAVAEGNFLAQTTGDLSALCDVSREDPLYPQAIHFCEGYIAGAAHYHRALASGPRERPIICPPNPSPTRTEAAAVFVAWAKTHPQFMNELPVEGLVRAFSAKWPCRG